VHQRQRAVHQPDQEDGVPLQSLGGVQRGQRHALDARGVLGRRALLELGDQLAHPGGRQGDRQVAGQPVQGGQRLPALACGAGPGRRGVRLPAQPGPQHVGHQVAERARRVEVRRPPRPAQQQDRLAHLGAVEEALPATDEVRHAASVSAAS
jgi:hypothetical protein